MAHDETVHPQHSALRGHNLRTRVRWYIKVRWLILACVAAPNLALQFIFQSPSTPLRQNLILSIAVTGYNCLLLWATSRLKTKGWLHALAVTQIGLDILAVTYLAYQNGGLDSHSPLLFIVPILAAGVIWSQRAMLVVASFCALLYSIIMVALFKGFIHGDVASRLYDSTDPAGFFNSLMFVDSVLIAVAVIGGYIIKLLRGSQAALNVEQHKITKLSSVQQSDAQNYQVRLNALIDSIGEGLIVVNEYGNVTDINKAATAILGYSKVDLVEKWFPKTVAAVDDEGKPIEPQERPLVKALETGRPISSRLSYVTKSGGQIPVFLTAAPFLVDAKPAGGVVVFRDFRHEQQVEQAKDEFISIVSHQLRTPLTAIRLFTEMLLKNQVGKLAPAQRDYLDKVETSTIRMIDLVGSILNVSRLELGRLKIEPTPTDLSELIKSRLDEVAPFAVEKQVRIKFTPPAKPLPKLDLDQGLIGEVIHNLLTNALRYSRPGKGAVEIAIAKHDDGYVISVADNGIGIPKDSQAKIFTRFFRAENAVAVEGEGTGLGLYLTKMIMETAKGKIWFKSVEKKGTTFYVRIPLGGMKPKTGDRSLSTKGNL